jgi:hypothetical protein
MTLDTIQGALKRRPFEPFRLRLSSGDAVEVRHPDQAMPLKSGLVIALPTPDEELTDRWTICSYLHIAAIESLNGTRRD